MTEGLATPDGRPTPELERLYGIWSDGGAGMLLSGNIIVDRDHLERPGNVVIETEPDADMKARLADWAKAATRAGNHFWAQISHGGRQTQKVVNPHPRSSSDVQLALPGGQFGKPVPLTRAEIADLVDRWAVAARSSRWSQWPRRWLRCAPNRWRRSQDCLGRRRQGWGGTGRLSRRRLAAACSRPQADQRWLGQLQPNERERLAAARALQRRA